MNELVKIERMNLGGQQVQTVNARGLHEFLGVKKDFSDWVKRQIDRARLVEGRDFVVITGSPQKGNGVFNPKPQIDYHLTIDAAKHISMMSGCDKGFEVRDYFIECEKIALAPQQPVTIPTHAEALRLAADLVEKNEALQKQIEADRPKTIFADAVSVSDTDIPVGVLAKILKQNGINIGRNRLFERMRDTGYLIKQGRERSMPTQKSMDLGLFRVIEKPLIDPRGNVMITKTVLVTGKGQLYFVNKFIEERDRQIVA